MKMKRGKHENEKGKQIPYTLFYAKAPPSHTENSDAAGLQLAFPSAAGLQLAFHIPYFKYIIVQIINI